MLTRSLLFLVGLTLSVAHLTDDVQAVEDSIVKRADEAMKREAEELELDLEKREVTYTIPKIVTVTLSTSVVVSFVGPYSLCGTAKMCYSSTAK